MAVPTQLLHNQAIQAVEPADNYFSHTQSPPHAATGDLDRFNQAMLEPAVERYESASIAATSPIKTDTLGDKILSGLQNLKSGFDVQASAIMDSVSKADPMSTQDMLKVQVDLAQFALRGELMNKTVSQGSQTVDTLLKSQ